MQENREVKEDGKQVVGNHSFQSLVQELPQKLSKNMSKNLSVPIAFVCLLHLANEKVSMCHLLLYVMGHPFLLYSH